jgi:hypothetical protein
MYLRQASNHPTQTWRVNLPPAKAEKAFVGIYAHGRIFRNRAFDQNIRTSVMDEQRQHEQDAERPLQRRLHRRDADP